MRENPLWRVAHAVTRSLKTYRAPQRCRALIMGCWRLKKDLPVRGGRLLPWRAYFHELCHSHQVGQGLRPIMHIAALDFDGDFADADLAGNLFVHETVSDQTDQFAFASRQRSEARATRDRFRREKERAVT
jgi:hypothetical protein